MILDHQIVKEAGTAEIKMWTNGVPVEVDALKQLINTAKMPFIFKHMAVMPDVHLGKGSTIGVLFQPKGRLFLPLLVWISVVE